MKALLTAFALLSFVAASTLPMVASAEDMKSDQTTAPKPDTAMSPDKGTTDQGPGKAATTTHKPHKTATHKAPHKKTTKKKTHHKHTAKKKPAPKDNVAPPKQG